MLNIRNGYYDRSAAVRALPDIVFVLTVRQSSGMESCDTG